MAETDHSHARDLLRHLDDPSRLQGNRFAARWLALGANVWACTRAAVAQLPEPLRTIVTRCDLAKELHAVVAADIGISERHFYRLRRQALVRLTAILLRSRVAAVGYAPPADPIGVRLSYAVAQHNAGNFSAAIATLEDLRHTVNTAAERIDVACRLSDICCSGGRFAAALTYVREAQRQITRATTSGDELVLLESKIDVTNLRLAWACGNIESVRRGADKAARRLRMLLYSSTSQKAAEELTATLLLFSKLKTQEGHFGEALSAALEAMALLDRYEIENVALRAYCAFMVADIRTYTGKHTNGVGDLRAAYASAQAGGLPLVAVNVAASLSGIYLVQGHMEQAVSYGKSALAIAQSICQPEELALTAIDIASIHLICRDLFEAKPLLRIARSQIPAGNVYLSTLVSLFEAEAYLIEGRYRFALRVADAGAHAMEDLRLNRYLGSALRIKAEAEDALGNSAAAGRAICESLEVLESSGHAFALARAYHSAARICHEPAYSAKASELTGAA